MRGSDRMIDLVVVAMLHQTLSDRESRIGPSVPAIPPQGRHPRPPLGQFSTRFNYPRPPN